MDEGRFQSIIERANDFLISNTANIKLPSQTKGFLFRYCKKSLSLFDIFLFFHSGCIINFMSLYLKRVWPLKRQLNRTKTFYVYLEPYYFHVLLCIIPKPQSYNVFCGCKSRLGIIIFNLGKCTSTKE